MSNFNKEDLFDKELYELFKKSEDEDYKIYLSADSSLKLSKREKRKIEKVAKGISPYSTLRKIAIIFAIIGVSFASLMSVKAIREKIIEVLVEWHEEYIKVDFSKDKTPINTEIQFEYKEPSIEQNYNRCVIAKEENYFFIEYEKDNIIISYHQYFIDDKHVFTSNNSTITTELKIGNYDAVAFTFSVNGSQQNTIMWDDEIYFYSITSSLSIEELKNIAETIK